MDEQEIKNKEKEEKEQKFKIWFKNHFTHLETYFDAGDQRRYHIACTFMRSVVEELLKSSNISRDLAGYLDKTIKSLKDINAELVNINPSNMSLREANLMQNYPQTWSLNEAVASSTLPAATQSSTTMEHLSTLTPKANFREILKIPLATSTTPKSVDFVAAFVLTSVSTRPEFSMSNDKVRIENPVLSTPLMVAELLPSEISSSTLSSTILEVLTTLTPEFSPDEISIFPPTTLGNPKSEYFVATSVPPDVDTQPHPPVSYGKDTNNPLFITNSRTVESMSTEISSSSRDPSISSGLEILTSLTTTTSPEEVLMPSSVAFVIPKNEIIAPTRSSGETQPISTLVSIKNISEDSNDDVHSTSSVSL
ncbi:unnamed protein product [Orchesella dallaii]|uniref:Uncharacterized protein n=1 Tax=Orchesella dallaii TaxID=48710 RepID=A0ABP1RJ26_9HEXA